MHLIESQLKIDTSFISSSSFRYFVYYESQYLEKVLANTEIVINIRL